MAKIRVPKPQPGSMNKDRKVSDLLKFQMRHIQEAERQFAHHHRSGINIEAIKTEGEAAEYIRRVTGRLHARYKVKVPKPHPGSMNKHRPISKLLKDQIAHFAEVEKGLPPHRQTGTDINVIQTEFEASEYFRKIMAILHPDGAKK